MVANARLRNIGAKVQGTNPGPAAAQVRLRNVSGVITSGAPPVAPVARVLLRNVSGKVVGSLVTPNPARVRLRNVAGYVGPLGTGPGSKPRGSAYTTRGGSLVAVGLYQSATP